MHLWCLQAPGKTHATVLILTITAGEIIRSTISCRNQISKLLQNKIFTITMDVLCVHISACHS